MKIEEKIERLSSLQSRIMELKKSRKEIHQVANKIKMEPDTNKLLQVGLLVSYAFIIAKYEQWIKEKEIEFDQANKSLNQKLKESKMLTVIKWGSLIAFLFLAAYILYSGILSYIH